MDFKMSDFNNVILRLSFLFDSPSFVNEMTKVYRTDLQYDLVEDDIYSLSNILSDYSKLYDNTPFQKLVQGIRDSYDELINFNFLEDTKNKKTCSIYNFTQADFTIDFLKFQNEKINKDNVLINMICNYALYSLMIEHYKTINNLLSLESINEIPSILMGVDKIIKKEYMCSYSIYKNELKLKLESVHFSKREVLILNLINKYLELIYSVISYDYKELEEIYINNSDNNELSKKLIELNGIYQPLYRFITVRDNDDRGSEYLKKSRYNELVNSINDLAIQSKNYVSVEVFKRVLSSIKLNYSKIEPEDDEFNVYNLIKEIEPIGFLRNMKIDKNLFNTITKRNQRIELNKDMDNKLKKSNNFKEDVTLEFETYDVATYNAIIKYLLNYFDLSEDLEIYLFLDFVTLESKKQYDNLDGILYYEKILPVEINGTQLIMRVLPKESTELVSINDNNLKTFKFNALLNNSLMINEVDMKVVRLDLVEVIPDYEECKLYVPVDIYPSEIRENKIKVKVESSIMIDILDNYINSKSLLHDGDNLEISKEEMLDVVSSETIVGMMYIAVNLIYYNLLKLEGIEFMIEEKQITMNKEYQKIAIEYGFKKLFEIGNALVKVIKTI